MEELNFDVFEGEQKKVLINLAEAVKQASESKESKDDLGFEDSALTKRDRANYRKVSEVWRKNGKLDPRSEQISIDQLLEKDIAVTKLMKDNFSTDIPMLIPRVLSNIVREAIEPNLVLTPLLTRVNYNAGTRVTFPTFGALANGAADIAEGEEYPEGTMELGGQTECIIGKSGIALKVTEEQRRYNQYDIISMNLRACGRALARLKERKVADMITANGTTLIDNSATKAIGVPGSTGRNASGTYNGTLTQDDIFKAWGTMINAGFVMNTLIMHPFAWKIFAEEGLARLFGFENGMAGMIRQFALGTPGSAPQWRTTPLNQNTWVSNPENIATTYTNLPSMFGNTFNIIVSPYMTFTSSNNTTDIVFCDVNELGLLVVDEDVVSDEWTDPSKDITKIKLRERYGIAVKNDGRGIGLLKSIKIAKSVDFADRIRLNYSTGDIPIGIASDDTYTGAPTLT